jgi:hypothetical protein
MMKRKNGTSIKREEVNEERIVPMETIGSGGVVVLILEVGLVDDSVGRVVVDESCVASGLEQMAFVNALPVVVRIQSR